MQCYNKQGGSETGRECKKKEEEKEESDFSPFYSHGYCSRAFHSSCHISFPAVHICVCVDVCLCVLCMCELCEGLAPPW